MKMRELREVRTAERNSDVTMLSRTVEQTVKVFRIFLSTIFAGISEYQKILLLIIEQEAADRYGFVTHCVKA